MKLAYVDESGGQDQSDIFVMAGLLVDAYSLRKTTADFDQLVTDLLARYQRTPRELKTKAFINGSGNWNDIPGEERKELLKEICDLAAESGKVFTCALNFTAFLRTADARTYHQPFGRNYWLSSSMFVAALIQKKMQKLNKNKGLTVLVMDDNQIDMPKLSDGLYEADPWYDALYQKKKIVRHQVTWVDREPDDRFDNIINTAFAIKSHHSSLIQVADAISYVFRRYLELQTEAEAWPGELPYFASLVDILEARREKLGQCPNADAVNFYKAVAPEGWNP